jgi:hypothetical protein
MDPFATQGYCMLDGLAAARKCGGSQQKRRDLIAEGTPSTTRARCAPAPALG